MKMNNMARMGPNVQSFFSLEAKLGPLMSIIRSMSRMKMISISKILIDNAHIENNLAPRRVASLQTPVVISTNATTNHSSDVQRKINSAATMMTMPRMKRLASGSAEIT